MFNRFIKSCHIYLRKRRFRTGRIITHFIAKDIRRDVEIIDAAEAEQGFITARIRTWNVLYAIKKIAPIPEFSEPRRVNLKDLWHWNGPAWGGPVGKENTGL